TIPPTTTNPTTTTPPTTTIPPTTIHPATNPPATTNPPTTTPPSITNPPATTVPTTENKPDVAVEGGTLDPAGPKVEVEGGTINAGSQAETWLGVDGTTTDMGKSTNPFDVSDVAHFLDIQSLINNTANTDKYFRLTADISLSSLTISNLTARDSFGFSASLICLNPALAISDPTKVFINLDGNGFKIKDLNISNTTAATCAIFGFLSANSVLNNIKFENCSTTVSYASARVIAVVAVQNMGTIQNCSLTGINGTPTINMSGTAGNNIIDDTFSLGTTPSHSVYIGYSAFVGDNQGTIKDCYFSNISINVWTRLFVGTVAGQNSGTITGINGAGVASYGVSGVSVNIYNNNDGSAQIGGIVGKNRLGAIVSDCTVWLPGTNNVNSFIYGSKIGGIAGVNQGSLSNCYVKGKIVNTGTVTGTLYDMKGYGGTFGGITGDNSGTVITSSAENIGVYFESTGNAVYGGIAGTNSGNGTTTGLITSCYASGKQADYGFSNSGYYLGGIVGSALTGTMLSSCYALVALSLNAQLAGALIGSGAKTTMLHATNHSYWSRQVSGWPTQCALNGADTYDIQRGVKTLNVAPSGVATVSKSLFTHSWGNSTVSINGLNTTAAFSKTSSNFSISESLNLLEVTGGITAGTYGKIIYNLSIGLPAGIGSAIQSTVVQEFSIDTVITSTAPSGSAVVSIDNPIVISNATEILLLRNVNYTDYKLGDNITMPTVSPNEWRTCIFAGTLNGNGKTITTGIPIFSKIYGSRDNTVPADINATPSPAEVANLSYGYVYNLNTILTANIASGVFGSVMGGTLKNIRLTGSSTSINLAVPTGDNFGAFLNYVRGNSFIYGCFTDVKVNIQSSTSGFIGGLIGNIDAEKATIDNCGSNSDISSTFVLSTIGSLIGGITLNTGVIKNSYAGGLVQRGGNIVVGNKIATDKLENVYWSIKDTNIANQATITPNNNPGGSDTVTKWSFVESSAYITNDPSVININLPSAINTLATAQIGDFSVSYTTANVAEVISMSIESGKLILHIHRDALAADNSTTELTLVHNTSGLRARIPLTTQGGLVKVGGFYQIKTPGDLQYFSQHQSTYFVEGVNCKLKLINNIYMT
ncbi:MAG: hypothetical protein WCN92_08255, partial [Eubacteriales bacterium]